MFSDVTLINEGLSSKEAEAHLLAWFKAYAYGQSEPLVLPSALMLKLAEVGKVPKWSDGDVGNMTMENFFRFTK